MITTDLGTLQTVIEQVLDQGSWYIKSYIDSPDLVNIIANIYLMNNTAVETTNRVRPLTVIASTNRISIIIEDSEATPKRSTYYKTEYPICQYTDLYEDIYNILLIIDVCLIRLQG